MKLQDVPAAVGVSRITIYNYRKRLGIVEETTEEVPEETVEQFKKMAASKIKPGPSNNKGKKKVDVVAAAQFSNDSSGFLEILPNDSTQLKNLKDQYNSNQVLINHLTKEINTCIVDGETPSKLESDMMEKYQKLNMSLARTIETLNPAEESLASLIKAKLASYSS
ncbi:hypothetical protein [Enterococcus sp. BWR-S5]|uniref:hypothetical protein n=1 Tax=Enterococcus sp. BWR-S5 TaxID=2787714 RepID=UPI001921A9A3|nr:hypothetical protein [Enterococcus sp. BWR-S5]MBL1223725.1 hypothetical protein [Enterococcus sp. BWR-S5]